MQIFGKFSATLRITRRLSCNYSARRYTSLVQITQKSQLLRPIRNYEDGLIHKLYQRGWFGTNINPNHEINAKGRFLLNIEQINIQLVDKMNLAPIIGMTPIKVMVIPIQGSLNVKQTNNNSVDSFLTIDKNSDQKTSKDILCWITENPSSMEDLSCSSEIPLNTHCVSIDLHVLPIKNYRKFYKDNYFNNLPKLSGELYTPSYNLKHKIHLPNLMFNKFYSTRISSEKPASSHVVCVAEGGKGCISPGNAQYPFYEPATSKRTNPIHIPAEVKSSHMVCVEQGGKGCVSPGNAQYPSFSPANNDGLPNPTTESLNAPVRKCNPDHDYSIFQQIFNTKETLLKCDAYNEAIKKTAERKNSLDNKKEKEEKQEKQETPVIATAICSKPKESPAHADSIDTVIASCGGESVTKCPMYIPKSENIDNSTSTTKSAKSGDACKKNDNCKEICEKRRKQKEEERKNKLMEGCISQNCNKPDNCKKPTKKASSYSTTKTAMYCKNALTQRMFFCNAPFEPTVPFRPRGMHASNKGGKGCKGDDPCQPETCPDRCQEELAKVRYNEELLEKKKKKRKLVGCPAPKGKNKVGVCAHAVPDSKKNDAHNKNYHTITPAIINYSQVLHRLIPKFNPKSLITQKYSVPSKNLHLKSVLQTTSKFENSSDFLNEIPISNRKFNTSAFTLKDSKGSPCKSKDKGGKGKGKNGKDGKGKDKKKKKDNPCNQPKKEYVPKCNNTDACAEMKKKSNGKEKDYDKKKDDAKKNEGKNKQEGETNKKDDTCKNINDGKNKEAKKKSETKNKDEEKKKEDPCKKKDEAKKDDPCKKKDEAKKDDACKKKDEAKKDDPCKKKDEAKKDDPCKKKDEAKKDDPCKKKDEANKDDPCKKKDGANKDDPCKKKDEAKKDDPCKKKDGAKKDDPCNKKDEAKKDDPCKKKDEAKKDDPCKKKDEGKKDDPCKKKDGAKKDDPCKKKDEAKKDDPCKKKDEAKEDDPCKKIDEAKKDDPCKKKDGAKKDDPCKEKDGAKKDDPCKKKDEGKKDDPCKKKDGAKKDDPCKKKDEAKKDDPCKKKDGAKKDDPCKKKDGAKKDDPCKNKDEAKKDDPCKKKDGGKKDDPCKKKDGGKKDDPCKKKDEAKKDDPCKKKDGGKKDDPCKKKDGAKKDDPCKKKDEAKEDDPCKKKDGAKKDDPCKKKDGAKSDDPCKKKDEAKKDDPCKKKDEAKKDDLCKKKDEAKKDDPCKKKDEAKKDDPCKKKDEAKKDDACKKKDEAKKDDPCKKKDEAKKGDPCKKKDEAKKDDPCKKEDGAQKKDDPCKKKDEAKKDDPCKKKDEAKKDDACKKKDEAKKDDPCKKKDEAKKDDPCKKKDEAKKDDPCKKKDEGKKDDPCKKKDEAKKDDPRKKKDEAKKDDPCKKEDGAQKKDDSCKKKDDKKKKCGIDTKDSSPNCKKFSSFSSSGLKTCSLKMFPRGYCTVKKSFNVSNCLYKRSFSSFKLLNRTTNTSNESSSIPKVITTTKPLCKRILSTFKVNNNCISSYFGFNRRYSSAKSGKGKKNDGAGQARNSACNVLKLVKPRRRKPQPNARPRDRLVTDCFKDSTSECGEKLCRDPKKSACKDFVNSKDKKTTKNNKENENSVLPILSALPLKPFFLQQTLPSASPYVPFRHFCRAHQYHFRSVILNNYDTYQGQQKSKRERDECKSKGNSNNEIIKICRACQIEKFYADIPNFSDYDVLIRTSGVAISGSDIHIYEHGSVNSSGISLGHDATGIVEKTGKCIYGLRRGDRVVMESGLSCGICEFCKRGAYNMCMQLIYNGFLMKYQVHPADLCHKLPDNLDIVEATLTHTLAQGCQAVFKAHVTPTTNVLIMGSSPIALASALCARAIGAKQVVLTCTMHAALESIHNDFEFDYVHSDASVEYGEVLEAIFSAFNDWPDVVINCSINERTMNLAVMTLRPCGICILAECESEGASFNALDVLMKNIRMLPSFRSTNMFPTALHLINSGRAPMSRMIAACFPWSAIEEAFQSAQCESNFGYKKVIVQCMEEDINYIARNS